MNNIFIKLSLIFLFLGIGLSMNTNSPFHSTESNEVNPDLSPEDGKSLWIENQSEEEKFKLINLVTESIEDHRVTRITNNVIKDIVKKFKISTKEAVGAIEWMKTKYDVSSDHLLHFVRYMWTKSKTPKYDGCTSKDHYYDELNVAVWSNLQNTKLKNKISELRNQLLIKQQNENAELKKDITEKEKLQKEYDNTENNKLNDLDQYISSQEDTEQKLKELKSENKKLKFQIRTSKFLIEATEQLNEELKKLIVQNFQLDLEEIEIKLQLENTIIYLENKLLKQPNENMNVIKRSEKYNLLSIENEKLKSKFETSQQSLMIQKKMNIYLRTEKKKKDDIKKQNKKPIQWKKMFFPKCLQKNQNKPENRI